MALTFSRKAADELQDRLARLLGDDGRGVWAGTFHAFGALLARRHPTLLPRGRTAGFAVMDRDDSRRAVKRLIGDLNLHEAPGELTELLYRAKRTTGPTLAALPEAVREAMTQLIPYEGLLESRNALDFADLLRVPVQLLEHHPDVRRHLQHRWRHMLVDEGQDLDLLRPVINLGENYRSTPEILSPAGRLIARNRRRLRKALTTQNPSGPVPEVRHFADDREEAADVAERIARWSPTAWRPWRCSPVCAGPRTTRTRVRAARAQRPRHLRDTLGRAQGDP